MKIAQVNLQPDFGGAERHVLLLARGLRASGHSVTVVCHPDGKLRQEAHSLKMPVLPLPARGQIDPGAVVRLTLSLWLMRPHVLHLHTPRDYLSGVLAARLARVPAVVITRHMLLPVKPLMRRVYSRVGVVICLTGAVRDNLRQSGVPEPRLKIVSGAIDTEEFALAHARRRPVRREFKLDESEICIGVVGRLVRGKGHECLLEAAARLKTEKSPAAKVLIVGDGPERAALQVRVEQLGLADRVIFAGFRGDMPAVMAALDILVLPSTDTEVLPLVLMEAMAAGNPVVATQVGSVPEIVEGGVNGLLVPPGDADALAAALSRLIAEPDLRGRLAAAGKQRVEQDFSLPRMVAATEHVYKSLCAR